MTTQPSYTRRAMFGMIAAIPMITSCEGSLAISYDQAGSGTPSPTPTPTPTPTSTPTASDGRPRYHIAAPTGGWINDPQRPLKIGDTWTLWALYNPTYPTGGTSWRRWTSKDLVTWEDKGVAIPRNTTAFGDVWTGSTVVDTANTAGFGAEALITLVTMPAPDAGGQNQSCALWYSLDGGASFTFHDIVMPNFPGHKDFRDPAVFWHAPTSRWVMTLSEEGKIGIYTSQDLKQWAYASGFLSDDVGRVMECSHLFKLHLYEADGTTSADKWILLVGGNGTARGFTVGTWYWVGDFDGVTFTATASAGQWLDGGADFYATVVWADPTADDPLASAYAIAWMSNWDYANQLPVTHDYRGQLSIVRTLRLQRVGDTPRLLSSPVPSQNSAFHTTLNGPDQNVAEGSDYTWPAGSNVSSCRIDLTLTRIGATWPAKVSLAVRKGGGFSTQIDFALRDNTVLLKRANSGPNAPDIAAWRQDRSVSCDFSASTATVTVFVDSGSVEVFLNNGVASMSDLILAPVTASDLQLSATGGSAKVSAVLVRPV